MQRHYLVVVAAPGREKEGRETLEKWLEGCRGVVGFRGGAVLREYADEYPGITLNGGELLALTFDLENAEEAKKFRKVMEKTYPLRTGLPEDQLIPDQIDAFVAAKGSDHGHSHDHDHAGGHSGGTKVPFPKLTYNLGDGLFARLLHVHCDIVAKVEPAQAALASSR